MECIQYTYGAARTKRGARMAVCNAYTEGAVVLCKDSPSLEEVAWLLSNGHLVRRNGDTTRFAFVDYDDGDHADITIDGVRSALADIPAIAILPSASGNPKKFHAVMDLGEDIPVERHPEACDRLRGIISERTGLNTFDHASDSVNQVMYGARDNAHPGRIPDSYRIEKMVKAGEKPVKVNNRFPTYCSSELAKRLGVDSLDENGYRVDVIIPHVFNHRFPRVKKGGRRKWAYLVTRKLLLRAAHLNRNCGGLDEYIDPPTFKGWLAFTIKVSCEARKDDKERMDRIVKGMKTLADKEWEHYMETPFGELLEENRKFFTAPDGRVLGLPSSPFRSTAFCPNRIQDVLDGRITAPGISVVPPDTIAYGRYADLENLAPLLGFARARGLELAAKRVGVRLRLDKCKRNALADETGTVIFRFGCPDKKLASYCARHHIPFRTLRKNETPPLLHDVLI